MLANPLPQSPFGSFAFSQMQVLEIVLFLIFFIWAVYSIVLVYHWVRYGHRSSVGIPVLIAHFVISIGLFALAASGFA